MEKFTKLSLSHKQSVIVKVRTQIFMVEDMATWLPQPYYPLNVLMSIFLVKRKEDIRSWIFRVEKFSYLHYLYSPLVFSKTVKGKETVLASWYFNVALAYIADDSVLWRKKSPWGCIPSRGWWRLRMCWASLVHYGNWRYVFFFFYIPLGSWLGPTIVWESSWFF